MPNDKNRIAGLRRVVTAELKALGELAEAGIRTSDFPRYDAQQQRVADAKADLRKAMGIVDPPRVRVPLATDETFPATCEACGNIVGLCTCQHPTLFQVTDILTEKGYNASYEYPGYVAVTMPGGRIACFGDVNVDYTANWEDGTMDDQAIEFFLPETATVPELTEAIESWIAKQLLSDRAAEILKRVTDAMQHAEEMDGPDDYVPLMIAIAFEANQRIATYIANHGGVSEN